MRGSSISDRSAAGNSCVRHARLFPNCKGFHGSRSASYIRADRRNIERGCLGWRLRSLSVLTERAALKTTSISLLQRLQASRPDETDWHRLQDIYLPLIRQWLGRVPGLGEEASDLAQEVLIVVVREIPRFERQREGSFRAWLRQVTVNRLRTHRKQRARRPAVGLDPADGFIERLADPNGDLAREWDLEHDRHVFQQLLTIVRPDFGSAAWKIFQQFALEGLPAAEVAAKTGVSVNAVIQAKARILKRLREEAGELLN
jgi:RNA polymerase sigma-70 factor (ECF subfamily)